MCLEILFAVSSLHNPFDVSLAHCELPTHPPHSQLRWCPFRSVHLRILRASWKPSISVCKALYVPWFWVFARPSRPKEMEHELPNSETLSRLANHSQEGHLLGQRDYRSCFEDGHLNMLLLWNRSHNPRPCISSSFTNKCQGGPCSEGLPLYLKVAIGVEPTRSCIHESMQGNPQCILTK